MNANLKNKIALFLILLSTVFAFGERAETLYQKGILFFNDGQYAKAEKLLSDAVKSNPDYAPPYFTLGIYYDTIAQNHKKAVDAYSRYIILNGEKKTKAQNWLVQITSLKTKLSPQENKNASKALKLYNKAVKKAQKKQYQAALKLVNDSIALLPYFIDSIYLRGRIYYQKHNFLNALRDFEQAYFYNPKYKDTAYYLALSYDLFSDKANQAYRLYEEVLNNPQTPPARKKIVQNLIDSIKQIKQLKQQAYEAYRQNNLTEVEKIYKQILDIRPNNITAYNNLGVIYMQEQKYTDAAEFLLAASKINPYDSHPNYNLACLYALQKKKDKALFYYKLAWPYMSEKMKQHSLQDSDLQLIKNEIETFIKND